MPKAKPKRVTERSTISGITDRRTDTNVHEIQCSQCGRFFYVDDKTMRSFQRAMVHDLSAPFICYRCEHKEKPVPFE